MNVNRFISSFNRLAELEFNSNNRFKGIAFRKTAHMIMGASSYEIKGKSVILHHEDGTSVTLGPSSSEVFIDIEVNGYSKRLVNTESEVVSTSNDDLTNISGIGEVKRIQLTNAGIKTVTDVVNLGLKIGDYFPGTKIRFTESMCTGLKLFLATRNKRITRELAYSYLVDFKENLIKNGIQNFEMYVLGSYRRKKPTIGDIDIVIVPCKDSEIIGDVRSVVKSWFDSIFVDGESKKSGVKGETQVDVRFIERKYLGAHMLHGTGSREFNMHLRGYAKSLGLRLNEWGIVKDGQLITFDSEKDIFTYLRIPYVSPCNR